MGHIAHDKKEVQKKRKEVDRAKSVKKTCDGLIANNRAQSRNWTLKKAFGLEKKAQNKVTKAEAKLAEAKAKVAEAKEAKAVRKLADDKKAAAATKASEA